MCCFNHVNNCQYDISCCCGARASHTLSTHTTQHLILRSVSYHRFYKHMCAQAITSRSITFATTRNTCAAKMSKIARHLDTVQFSYPSSALVTLVHCDGHSRFITVSKSLYDFGHFFSTCVSCGYIVPTHFYEVSYLLS